MKPPTQYPTIPAAVRYRGTLLPPQGLHDQHAFLSEAALAEAGVVW